MKATELFNCDDTSSVDGAQGNDKKMQTYRNEIV